MNYSKLVNKHALAIAALMLTAGNATAAQQEWTEIDAEINSCVAAVADHANYNDATRVRHAVVGVKERTVGYKLTIETSLYNETSKTAIREYATSCVINGNNAPMKFTINETNNDA